MQIVLTQYIVGNCEGLDKYLHAMESETRDMVPIISGVGKNLMTDPFYRYKMPSLQARIEGGRRKTKTVLINLEDMCKSLNRPPLYVLKYFAYELGTSSQLSKLSGVNKYMLLGVFDVIKLREILAKFIDKFVICINCNNPETKLIIDEPLTKKTDTSLSLLCQACGNHNRLSKNTRGVDNKMINYIVREHIQCEHSFAPATTP
ncbi:MAG: eukaryotic translation initiation factor eIF-2-beta/eIF-5 family protein [Gammaproteobacteria bacterium]|nr:MAG: eukaryotic translation initiation factor eIF-2-beta/eIF-5 family protein [Gammaproteobacteria bacterium]